MSSYVSCLINLGSDLRVKISEKGISSFSMKKSPSKRVQRFTDLTILLAYSCACFQTRQCKNWQQIFD